MKLTQERLKELFHYDPDIGVFIRKVRAGMTKVGDVAGSLDVYGYRNICIDRKFYKAHRLAFLWMEGYIPENHVDHIDRNKANNKWSNLREVSQTCNMRNCNISKNNKSGVTGVCKYKATNKWSAQTQVAKKIHLGLFPNIMDAAKARWQAEVKYNFPNCNTTSSAYIYLKENGAI